MRKRKIALWIGLGIICVIMLGLGGAFWKYMPFQSQVVKHHILKATPTVAMPSPTPPVWQGMRLVIPVLGLDAPVEPVSVLSGGQLGVPTKNQWDGVGWYQDGPAPGARGSSVIDGHLDRPGGAPAVFWHLRELHAGDEVQVISAQGKVQRFRVRAVQAYRPQDAPLDTIFEDNSGSYLNLITCAGQWVPAQHQTTLRLVVYTTLEQS